jgi:hypothetical protein
MPKRQQRVKAYRGTVLLACLFDEALVGLPVVRVLRVEFVGPAGLPLVFCGASIRLGRMVGLRGGV